MMHGRRVEWAAAGLLAFGQSACTSMVPIESTDAEAMLAAIEAGDRVSVVDVHGATTELEVTAVGGDFIEGLADNDAPVRIAAAEVQAIRERRVAVGKTIALGAGLGFLLFVEANAAAGYEWYW